MNLRRTIIRWLSKTDDESDSEPQKVRSGSLASQLGLISKNSNNAKPSRGISTREGQFDESFDSRFTTPGIIFKVTPGQGGIAIETRIYDNKINENRVSLCIVHKSDGLGEELAKIVSLSALRY